MGVHFDVMVFNPLTGLTGYGRIEKVESGVAVNLTHVSEGGRSRSIKATRHSGGFTLILGGMGGRQPDQSYDHLIDAQYTGINANPDDRRGMPKSVTVMASDGSIAKGPLIGWNGVPPKTRLLSKHGKLAAVVPVTSIAKPQLCGLSAQAPYPLHGLLMPSTVELQLIASLGRPGMMLASDVVREATVLPFDTGGVTLCTDYGEGSSWPDTETVFHAWHCVPGDQTTSVLEEWLAQLIR